MKKLLKKTWFALLLCLVCVVASTLLNTRFKFGPLCDQARAGLYKTDANNIDLRFELNDYCSCLDTLIDLAASLGIDTAAATERNDALRQLLQSDAVEARELHGAYASVLSESDALSAALSEFTLGTHDSATLTRCLSSLETASSAIERFGYNAAIDAFLSKYDHFPTNSLAAAVGLRYPERFA